VVSTFHLDHIALKMSRRVFTPIRANI